MLANRNNLDIMYFDHANLLKLSLLLPHWDHTNRFIRLSNVTHTTLRWKKAHRVND
jgi:hypothetical protein